MKILKGTFLIFFGVLMLTNTAFAGNFVFTRNLKIGDSGSGVKQLQIFLNSDSGTRIAIVGAGSPGNETEYFGNGTARALVKLQEKYASEILMPNGLSKGTGFFGSSTRAKINAILAKIGSLSNPYPTSPLSKGEEQGGGSSSVLHIPSTVAPPATPLTTPSNSSVSSDLSSADKTIGIIGVSPLYGPVGTTVLISGIGFLSENNSIQFNDSLKIENISPSNGNLSFKIPNNFGVGRYSISISNANGTSQNKSLFIITNGKNKAPEISSVLPTTVSVGEEITVKGSGFTNSGNIISTSFGTINNISSTDGDVIKFRLTPVSNGVVIKPTKTFSLPVHFYVSNENGISSSAGIVNINY